jgi:hypothetical protein
VEKYSRCEGGMKWKFEGDYSAKAEKGKSFEAKPKKPEATKPAFETYTPLSKSRSEILSIHRQVLRDPAPMKASDSRQQSNKWCAFHKDRGHETDDCYQLKA